MPILLQLAQSYSNPDSVNYKIAYLREQTSKNLGYSSFEEQAQLAMLGKTVIVGGYLNTELIKAKSIVADQLNVDDLSAITGKFTSLMSGVSGGARLEMGESAGEPFLEAYDSANDLRVKLLQDSLEFSAGGITGGKLEAEYFGAGGEEGRAGLLLSSTYSIKMLALYYAWMETHGAAVQCAGKSVVMWADSVIGLGAPEIDIYGDIKLNGNKLLNFAYESDDTQRETSMSTYTNDYNLLMEISVKAGEYYMVQFEGAFWVSAAGTQMNAYVDVIGSAARVSGPAYLGTGTTERMDFTGSTMSIWRADADGKLSFIMRWRAVGGGTAYCQYRSMKAWRIG